MVRAVGLELTLPEGTRLGSRHSRLVIGDRFANVIERFRLARALRPASGQARAAHGVAFLGTGENHLVFHGSDRLSAWPEKSRRMTVT